MFSPCPTRKDVRFMEKKKIKYFPCIFTRFNLTYVVLFLQYFVSTLKFTQVEKPCYKP